MLEKYKSAPKPLSLSFVLRHPAHLVATGFGAGLARPAPGTWGALLGVLLYALASGLLAKPVLMGLAVAILVVGTWATHVTGRNAGVHDHPGIVVDEILGVWIAALLAPQGLIWLAAAFGFFRFFDIVKVFPANYFDAKVSNAFGVMADDAVAGLYAGLACMAVDLLW